MLKMLHQQEARKVRSLRRHRIGLAVAGGGPIGGIYEMGALRALDEAIEGLDLTRLDVYVGVSSGAFLAAGLANRVDSGDMCRMFITEEDPEHQFRPEMFLKPAFFEYIRLLSSLPKIIGEWLLDVALHPGEIGWSDTLGRLGSAIPTGLFDNEGIERYLNGIFNAPGRTNDFRKLKHRLFLVATNLDSGETGAFGSPGHDDIPISVAVQASTALPGLFPPVHIGDHYYVDGALIKTLHASVADVADMQRLMDAHHPKLVSLTHVPSNTGLIQPVEAVGELCAERDIYYLVDGCQSVGQIPVEVKKIKCDFLSATLRKFLRGPRGAGFLYVSDKIINQKLEPLFIDMRGADWITADEFTPRMDARRFEDWELPYALVLASKAAIDLALAVGINEIQARNKHLCNLVREAISAISHLRLLDIGEHQSRIITVEIPNRKPQEVLTELRQQSSTPLWATGVLL